MGLHKRGKYWHYDFWYNGQRYKASTKQTSKTAAAEVEVGVRRGLRERAVHDITFERLAKKYLRLHAKNKRSKTFYEYTVKVLRRYFGEILLSRIDPAEVDAFMAGRRAEVKASTANRSLTVLKHMLTLAVRWGHLSTNPAAGVKREREPKGRERYLTEGEASRLVAACTPWLRAVVVVALHTGARQGELLGLTWDAVDLDRGLLEFRRTKNGEARTVRLSEAARATLRELPSRFKGGAVFRNHGGEPIHRDGLTWSFRRAVKRAGLAGFRFHDLRHSAASFWVQAGVPLNTVREILGHRSLTMTLRYAHLAPGHQAAATAVMDGLAVEGAGVAVGESG
jgi:integrase